MVTTLAGPGSVAGGVWEVVANQSRALLDAGLDVSIVAGWLGDTPPVRIRDLPVDLVAVQPVIKQFGLRAVTGRGWEAAVRRAADGADVAHVHLCRDWLTTRATRTIHTMGVPIVAQTHGMLRRTSSPVFASFDTMLTRPAIRRADEFITLTDAEKPLLEGLDIASDRLTTIENAVPEPSQYWRGGTFSHRLLFVSRLHPRKQVMVFAEVVANLRTSGLDVQGIIAGPDQGDLSQLLAFINDGAHGKYIHYIGELDRPQLVEELSRATVLVFPARNEPFGLVLIEAMSVGTPILCTNETPLAARLLKADAAMVEVPEADRLTAAASQLLQNSDLQEGLSRKGRALYRSHWTNDAMLSQLLELYAKVWAPKPQTSISIRADDETTAGTEEKQQTACTPNFTTPLGASSSNEEPQINCLTDDSLSDRPRYRHAER